MSRSSSRIHERVADHIRSAIAAGRLRPGDKLPSLPELSGQFDCSYAPVRQALAALASAGMVQPRQGAGVFVCEPVREKVIGIIMHNLRAPDHAHLTDHLTAEAEGLGYSVMLCVPHARRVSHARALKIEREFVDKLARTHGAGIIKCPTGTVEEDMAFRRAMRQAGIRFVIVNDYWSDCHDAHQVLCDRRVGLELAVEHLQGLGHRHIAFFTTPGDREPSAIQAFREVTAERRVAGELVIGLGDEALQLVQDSRRSEAPITAIIALFHELAAEILHRLQAAGIAVPDEVSVLALSGPPDRVFFPLQITTVEPQLVPLAQSAVRLLLEDAEAPVTHQRFPPVLRAGETTAARAPCAGAGAT